MVIINFVLEVMILGLSIIVLIVFFTGLIDWILKKAKKCLKDGKIKI